MYSQLKPFMRGYVRYAYLRRPSDYRRALERQRPQLRYVGWLGHKNIGDEILFEAFREEIFTDCLVVPYEDFSLLSAMASPRRTTAVVLGGGTLINDAGHLRPLQQAQRGGQPFFVFGTGVSDPDYWRQYPGARRVDVKGWLDVLAAASYVGVRGPRSCEWLRSHGISHAEVIGDPALSIQQPVRLNADGSPVLGINLGTHDPVQGVAGADFVAAVALIKAVLQRGWKVRYLAMHPIDQGVGDRLKGVIDDPAFQLPPFDPHSGSMVRKIAACNYVVGERLHITVLACAVAVPNLSLSYQPKCLDFLESIGREDLAVKTDDVTGALLIERLDWLQSIGPGVSEQIRTRCDTLRALQQQRAREVVRSLQA